LLSVGQLQILSQSPTATADDLDKKFTIAFTNWLNDVAKAAKSDPKVLEAYGQIPYKR
jgi:hypothetical protein